MRIKAETAAGFKTTRLKKAFQILVLLLHLAQAQKVQLQGAMLYPESTAMIVSKSVSMDVELNKVAYSNNLWQTNQCFELLFESPYSEPRDYETFLSSNQPTCSTILSTISVQCKIKPFQSNTLQFWFPTIEETSKTLQKLRFHFDNFNTPYSQQMITKIFVTSYSDLNCLNDAETLQVPINLNFLPDYIPSFQVKSSSTLIGNRDPENTLTYIFSPKSQLAARFSRAGRIHLGIPNLFETISDSQRMYNPSVRNQCSSNCFETITEAFLQNGYINIKYEGMAQFCLNSQVTISCKGFYNPVYQGQIYGWWVETWDNVGNEFGKIDQSDRSSTYLDTSSWTPHTITASSFQIVPYDVTIQTPSIWDLNLMAIGIPLNQQCYIQLMLPPDLNFEFQLIQAQGMFVPKSLQTTLTKNDIDYYPATEDQPYNLINFVGCYQMNSFGRTPMGSIKISDITTQNAMYESGDFGMKIFKDQYFEQQIAQLAPGVFVKGQDLISGKLSNLKISPLVNTVQIKNIIYFEFTAEHDVYPGSKLSLTLPEKLQLPQSSEMTVIGQISSTSEFKKSVDGQTAIVVDQKRVEINDFTQNTIRKGPYIFKFGIEGISNQRSNQDAGGFELITYYKQQKNGETRFYQIDSGNSQTSFTAQPNFISSDGNILVEPPLNNNEATKYTITFTSPSEVPIDGFIDLTIANEVQVDWNTILEQGTCRVVSCERRDEPEKQIIRIKNTSRINKNSQKSIEFQGLKNPRSFKPTGPFLITTYDTELERKAIIDQGFNRITAMTQAGDIIFSFSRTSEMNGAVNDYTFTIKSSNPLKTNDVFTMSLPAQLKPILPTEQSDNIDPKTLSQCIGISAQITCSISLKTNTITIQTIENPLEFQFKVTNIQNPPSLKESDSFSNFKIVDQEDYLVSQYQLEEYPKVKNVLPASINSYKLVQESLVENEPNAYKISFVPTNFLPSTTVIKIIYPEQISPKDGSTTGCFVTTNQIYQDKCEIKTETREIFIKKAFDYLAIDDLSSNSLFSTTVTILIDFINPVNNFPGKGFSIYTYENQDESGNPIDLMDQAENILQPKLMCEWPCATCADSSRQMCTSCWKLDNVQEKYFMARLDGSVDTCKAKCDHGFTANGNTDFICTRCSESCNGCEDNGKVGDIKECLECSSKYPLRQENTNFCFMNCPKGFYSIGGQCKQCSDPCLTCSGSSNSCTSCDPQSVKAHLYQSNCIDSCPTGTTDVGNICQKCTSPCQTCVGQTINCLSCDNTEGRGVLYQNFCYDECPAGFATDYEAMECIGCYPGCALCDKLNPQICFKCISPLGLVKGECQGSCPFPLKERDGVCIKMSEADDLVLMYFPFTIAAILFIFMVLSGLLKKKGILINGQVKRVSLQNSVPTMCAFIAPIQLLCILVQAVLCYLFDYQIHSLLAIGAFLIAVVINFAFMIWFLKSFYSKYLPAIGSRVKETNKDKLEKLVDITILNQHLYPQDVDPWFAKHVNTHRVPSYFLFALTGVTHFKIAKMFYSFYFMFGLFKAKWHRATYFRQSLVKWGIAYIVLVDSLIIVFSIIGLTQLRPESWQTQIWICMTESIILSVLSIVLACLEFYQLKHIFKYTENVYKPKATQMKKFNKLLKIRKITPNVDNWKKHFKDRKLEELLEIFGTRMAKSLWDMETGWEKEVDKRELYTWPISPKIQDQVLKNMPPKFEAKDAFDVVDNCYFEAKNGLQVRDMNIQAGDGVRQEFQDALNRKQNEMVISSFIDSSITDEIMKIKTARKRGRNNKYYSQIDQEDELDQQALKKNDEEQAMLQLVKEQEDEEEQMKNIINESTIKAKEIAAARQLRKQEFKAKQRAEQAELKRQMRKEREEAEMKARQEAEQAYAKVQEEKRRKLEKQIEKERKEREAKESEEMRLAIEASFLMRQEFEKKETERLKAEEIARKHAEEQAEKERLERLEQERIERENEIKRREQEKEENLRRQQEEVRLMQEAQEMMRNREKEKKKQEEERIRQERLQKEEAEREAIRLEREKEEEEIRLAKEMERARKLQLKQAERAQRELERQERLEQERVAKELRRQQEEIIKAGKADQKIKEKKAREEAIQKEKGELRQAAKVYARNLTIQAPIDYDLPSAGITGNSPKGSMDSPSQLSPISLNKKGTLKRSKTKKKKDSPRRSSKSKSPQRSLEHSPSMRNEVGRSDEMVPKPKPHQIASTERHPQFGTISHDRPPLPIQQRQVTLSPKKYQDQTMISDAVSDFGKTFVNLNEEAVRPFQNPMIKSVAPPQANLRMFNEHDCLGDIERDEKGNVVVLQDNQGRTHDRQRNPVNNRGYLIDPRTADVVENVQGKTMFPQKQLDEKGELPAPYCIEKHNFNPHLLSGDFEYQNGAPLILKNEKGELVDRQGKRVNPFGWYIDPKQPGALVDVTKRKKFDRRQLLGPKFLDLPKLYNYQGRRFDIRDCMGQFDKNPFGEIQLNQSPDGSTFLDSYGHPVNDKGYLIDEAGNIIDKQGRQLWKYSDLKNGEFIKIFPFLKFNIQKVQAEVQVSKHGNPILNKQPDGTYLDQLGRLCNQRGYLTDQQGNVIDVYNNLMFDKCVLDHDGEIPPVFRGGQLRQDTASSISRLMSELERHHGDRSEFNITDPMINDGKDGDTSVDSKMDDTPANYNVANQRYEHESDPPARPGHQLTETIDDFANSEYSRNAAVLLPKKRPVPKPKKRKKNTGQIEFLEPSESQKQMAGAYGGEVRPEIRRPKVKYDKERLQGSKKFRLSGTDEPGAKADLNKLAGSQQNIRTQNASQDQNLKRKSNIAMQEPDFEEVYGKDIDQFLEDSEWDIDNFQLDASKNSREEGVVPNNFSGDLDITAIEKYYLDSESPRKSDEARQPRESKMSRKNPSPQRGSKNSLTEKNKVGPPRETIMSVTDDPQVIHRGEILEFDTLKKAK